MGIGNFTWETTQLRNARDSLDCSLSEIIKSTYHNNIIYVVGLLYVRNSRRRRGERERENEVGVCVCVML